MFLVLSMQFLLLYTYVHETCSRHSHNINSFLPDYNKTLEKQKPFQNQTKQDKKKARKNKIKYEFISLAIFLLQFSFQLRNKSVLPFATHTNTHTHKYAAIESILCGA